MKSRCSLITIVCLSLTTIFASWCYLPSSGYAHLGSLVPYLVKDINPTGDTYPKTFIPFRNQLFFFADNGQNRTLWKTDGSMENTTIVKDIYPGEGGVGSIYHDSHWIIANNAIYFTVSQNDNSHNELWKSDGTAAGTVLVRHFDGHYIDRISTFNGKVYFTLFDELRGEGALWWSDGTEAGTKLIEGTFSHMRFLFEFDNSLYLIAQGARSGDPTNIWKVHADTMTPAFFVDRLESIILYQDAIYYGSVNALWKSDGTQDSAEKIVQYEYNQNISELTVLNDILYFTVGVNTLWMTNGSTDGTVQIDAVSFGTHSLMAHNNRIYFATHNRGDGVQIGSTDGTANGTVLYPPPTETADHISDLTPFDGFIYFFVSEGNAIELWRTDSVGNEATQIMTITPDVRQTDFQECPCMAVVGNNLYITAQTAEGVELWAIPAEQTATVTPTATNTPTLVPTSTFVPTSTSTSPPTSTLTPTSTPTSVSVSTATPTLVATQAPRSTDTPSIIGVEQIYLPVITN